MNEGAHNGYAKQGERSKEIQEEWTEDDFIRRKGVRFPAIYEAWSVPTMKSPNFAK